MKKTLIIFLLFSFNVYAETSKFNQQTLIKIESYLNKIQKMKSDFAQLNPDGSISEGKFYLSKPGKFRWEYYDQPLILVTNGKSLIYYDTELEQANYVDIEDSIAVLITRKNLTFAGDVTVTNLIEAKDFTKITFVKEGQKDIGEFSFIFKQEPFELGKIELTDNQGQEIQVTFFNMDINPEQKMPRSLFQIKDPRLR